MASAAFYQAFVEIVPEARNLRKTLSREFDAAGPEAGRIAGKGVSGGILSSMRGIAAPLTGILVGALGVASIGSAFKGGISRLLNIEDAQAKLSGLGHDAASVTTIMNSALESVKGTAYGLDEAATIAASAVAAGIKPGRELTKYLTLTADAAAISGDSLGNLGNVMNNVTTVGAAYNDSLQILAQKGLPIYQWLSDEMGVSTAAVKDLASEGQVSSEMFRKAIEDNISGAALSAGDTTRGALANMLASFNRTAANLLSGVFPVFKDAFQRITQAMAPLEETAKAVGEKVGLALSAILPAASDLAGRIGPVLAPVAAALAPLGAVFSSVGAQLVDVWQGFSPLTLLLEALVPLLPSIADGVVEVGTALAPLLPALGDAVAKLTPALTDLIAAILPVLLDLIVKLLPPLAELLIAILPPLVDALVVVTGAIGDMAPAISVLATVLAGFIGWLGTPTQEAFHNFADLLNGFGPIGQLFGSVISGIGDLLDLGLLGALGRVQQGFIDAILVVASFPGQALSALGDLGSLLIDSGAALIQGFIDGITGMLGGVGDAIGGVMDFAAGFFPHSPAERGPFSGSGWAAIKDAGLAIGDQFGAGLTASEPGFNAKLASMVDVPTPQRFDASVYGSASTGDSGAPGAQVIQNIFPQPRQSEEEIGNASAKKINRALRK